MLLNKIRYNIKPYRPPEPDPENEIKIFKNWLKALRRYSGSQNIFKGSNVLEIGINKNISSALIAQAIGADQYNIIDFYPHHEALSPEFFKNLSKKIKSEFKEFVNFSQELLIDQSELIMKGLNDNLHFSPIEITDFSNIDKRTIDLIISQAAFEHIKDIETSIQQMSIVAKSGAILLAEVDLKTHTRWLRDVDPLNIYRYATFIYEFAGFSVMPNRIRPYQYKDLLERNGWQNIIIKTLEELDVNSSSYKDVKVSKKFRSKRNTMEQLSILICATKN